MIITIFVVVIVVFITIIINNTLDLIIKFKRIYEI
jgi:hypothetical protein